MSNDKRMKASDVFRESEYVFSSKTSFEEAFPQIKNVEIEVEEIGVGVSQWIGKSVYTRHVGEFIDCHNPTCYNGGFSIGKLLREMVKTRQTDLEETEFCQGNEGSPKGKRLYRKCWNKFNVKVHIDYKESAQ